MNQALPPIAKTLSHLGLVLERDLVQIVQSEKTAIGIIKSVIDKNLIESEQLSHALSKQFGTPLFDLSATEVDALPREHIDMKIVERHHVLPCGRRDKTLFVAVIDPTNKSALDQIKFTTGLQVVPIQAEYTSLTDLINKLASSSEGSLDDGFEDDLDLELEGDEEAAADDPSAVGADDAPIVKYVNKLLIDAINQGASDIHIEPFEKELRVRYRIDGILHTAARQPASYSGRIVARLKIISKLDIAEKRAPQDGRVKLRISRNKAFDFRVNTLPTVHGEKVVMRILDASAAKLDLNVLGFTKKQLALYKHLVDRPYGMVLITGPTGSGKTVTLYSALNMLNDPGKNISTVEDPVEIQLPGITQVNINEKANLNFASALRAFLRQDPDIIMLGEIRDLETAEIAIKAAQTGHMVLSTLHTNDAPATLTRLLNMGVPAFNVASAVNLIVAQRLVRRLCKHCREDANLPQKALLDAGFVKGELDSLSIFKPNSKGCKHCTEGYKGRAGIYQTLPITDKIKNLIMEGCTENDIERAAEKDGVLDLRGAGLIKVREGITSLEEVERVTNG